VADGTAAASVAGADADSDADVGTDADAAEAPGVAEDTEAATDEAEEVTVEPVADIGSWPEWVVVGVVA
jgi:hypothetical protein